MKMAFISGNIGKDAVTRTAGETTVTGFNVAVEGRRGGEKTTTWFECNLWGTRGKSLEQYLTKGSKVSVAGDFDTREHDGKTYLVIRVDQVSLLGGKPADDAPRQSSASRASMDAQRPPARDDIDADSIPF